MKIFNIIQRYYPAIGGSEAWCRNLCLFLTRRGMFVKVATINMYNAAEAFEQDYSEDGTIKLGRKEYDNKVFIKRYTLWKPWSNSLSARVIKFLLYRLKFKKTQIGDIFRTSPHSFEMYRNLFKEIKSSDIVFLHTLPYFHILVGYLIAKIYHKITVIIPHFHPEHIHYERKFFYLLMNHCDAVIAVSEYEKKHLIDRNVNSKKIFVSGNAVNKYEAEGEEIDSCKQDLFYKYGINGKLKKIIFIGRKEIYKGVLILIEAAKKLSKEADADLYLFLVGPDTPDFNKAYSNLNDLRRLKIINFGILSEQQKNYLLELSDLLVLPSDFEAFGIVLLEAWKYGKPVIATNRGAMPDIIGEAGLCVEYGNVDALKDKMKMILFDETLSKKMGEIGRERVYREYNVEKVYGNVVDVINILRQDKKKILIVSHLFPPYSIGGSEVVAYEQSKMLKKMGFEIKIFAGKINDSLRRFGISRKKGELETTFINLHNKDFDHIRYINFNKEELEERFREELYNYAPDIVHFHNIYAFSLKMIDDCYEAHIHTVMTLHDYWGICPNNLLLKKDGLLCYEKDKKCFNCYGGIILENMCSISYEEQNLKYLEYCNKIDLLISPSRYLAERYIERGIAQTKFKIIKNGIDLHRFKRNKKLKSKKICFGFIGQIIRHKGIENLLKAMSLLNKNEKEQISLLIVGTGNSTFLNYCKDLAKGLNFVTFIGKVNNKAIHRVYNNINAAIVPSIWPENSPLAIQEALAMGIPVIAPNIGGVPELIEDRVNGFLYSHNDIASLAEIIKEIIRNPEILNSMESACITRAKENDLAEQVKIIADEYRKLVRQ